MATAVIMPRQGQSVESCIIGEMHVKKGDKVKAGDPLFTYETDKSTFDEESKLDGEVIAVFFGEDDDVPCLYNVLVIGEAGEDWKEFIPEGATRDGAGEASAAEGSESKASEAETAGSSARDAAGASASEPSEAEEIKASAEAAYTGKISPRARTLAEKKHADLRFASASGPNGRVIERDVEVVIREGHTAAAGIDFTYDTSVRGSGIGGKFTADDLLSKGSEAEAPASIKTEAESLPEYEDVKLPNIRKVIAKAMNKSLSEMAQLTLNASFDATDVIEFRNMLKKAVSDGLDEKLGFELLKKVPTYNDIVLYAVSRTVLEFKDLNAHFLGDKMRYFNHVNLGCAVDTPRGLMVPVVRNAEKLSISEISSEVRKLASACREGSINPDLLKGSSISVTNLGTLGIESFTPIINPPETAILGVGGLQDRVKISAGELKAYKVMGLSLTIDHRAVDGAPGARFLSALCRNLENFRLLIMEK